MMPALGAIQVDMYHREYAEKTPGECEPPLPLQKRDGLLAVSLLFDKAIPF